MANRLAAETSPYLRQHANNPVDWYPWGEEALSRAKTEDRPILLSIGYSACHWCHVMEHESFANSEIAALMNQNFINIKVDREERPDLDQLYQNVSQLMTRSGGWPLTVFLTPDLLPYFGGTYFPPEDRWGRPGFPKVLQALAEAYRSDRQNVLENARRLTDAIGQLESQKTDERSLPTTASLRKLCDAIMAEFDWQNGGLKGAPKFPNPMLLTYLWRFGQASGFGMAQDATLVSLVKMASGGLYDQLGGGFHRYAVDEKWAVPHFEKMLYDNALLLRLYSEVLVTASDLRSEDRDLFAEVVGETTRYVLREMRATEGGFYSTQDADSEGVEGKYFVWNPRSLREALSEEEARVFEARYGVTPEGNFEHSGQTVLAIARSTSDVAHSTGLPELRVRELLASGKEKLLRARQKRVSPALDDKIIASWNGLMITGLAWASRALASTGQGELAVQAAESARVAMEFVIGRMHRSENRLYSVYKDGAGRLNAYLDDYAFLAAAALELSRTLEDVGEIEVLTAQARGWMEVVLSNFADRENGGWYFTSDDHEKLFQRPKSVFDQAIPSGNSVALECLLALGALTERSVFEASAEENLGRLFGLAERAPLGMGELACAALLYVSGPVTVAGPGASQACSHPHVFQNLPSRSSREQGNHLATRELLVCHRKACELPLTDPLDARVLALKKTVF